MIKLWELIVHGCWHKWIIREVRPIQTSKESLPHAHAVFYQCDRCGRLKRKDLQ